MLSPRSAMESARALFPLPLFPMMAISPGLNDISPLNQEWVTGCVEDCSKLMPEKYLVGLCQTLARISGSAPRNTRVSGS